MKLQIYTVQDKKTEEYGNPMFLRTHGEAIRGFADAVNKQDENNSLYKHPEDYALFHIGEYETTTARITSSTANCLIQAIDTKA